MNIQANTRQEYFNQAGDLGADLRAVDSLIKKTAPNLEPVLFNGMGGGVVLGYGMQPYQSKSMKQPGEWPLVVLAKQKNYTSLYICAIDKDGQYIAQKNAERLGKVKCGKSCIRFKSLDDLNLSALRSIVGDVAQRTASGEKLFGI